MAAPGCSAHEILFTSIKEKDERILFKHISSFNRQQAAAGVSSVDGEVSLIKWLVSLNDIHSFYTIK